MPKLSDAERDAFLTEPGVLLHLATLAPDGRPEVAPIWFVFEEGAVWFTPGPSRPGSGTCGATPACPWRSTSSLLPYRKVLIDGRAELVHDLDADDLWRDRYRRSRAATCRPRRPSNTSRTRSTNRARCGGSRSRRRGCGPGACPVGDEAGTGIWHARYYLPGTKMARRLPPG